MSRSFFVTFHNAGTQNSPPDHTITVVRSDAQGDTSCMNQRGPDSFSVEPQGIRLVVLIDNNGIGRCNGSEKKVTWTWDEGRKKFSLISVPTEGGRKTWVDGEVVGAYCDGKPCMNDKSPVTTDSDPITIDIFL